MIFNQTSFSYRIWSNSNHLIIFSFSYNVPGKSASCISTRGLYLCVQDCTKSQIVICKARGSVMPWDSGGQTWSHLGTCRKHKFSSPTTDLRIGPWNGAPGDADSGEIEEPLKNHRPEDSEAPKGGCGIPVRPALGWVAWKWRDPPINHFSIFFLTPRGLVPLK